MSYDGSQGKRYGRQAVMYRYGYAHCISEFCQYRSCYRYFPNTGLPLPFISFGSSSLISIFIGMGLVLNVGLQRVPRHY